VNIRLAYPQASRVEVFAWATDAEKAAVDPLEELFAEAFPGQEFVNPVLAVGPRPLSRWSVRVACRGVAVARRP
jgi:hypothetical protein